MTARLNYGNSIKPCQDADNDEIDIQSYDVFEEAEYEIKQRQKYLSRFNNYKTIREVIKSHIDHY